MPIARLAIDQNAPGSRWRGRRTGGGARAGGRATPPDGAGAPRPRGPRASDEGQEQAASVVGSARSVPGRVDAEGEARSLMVGVVVASGRAHIRRPTGSRRARFARPPRRWRRSSRRRPRRTWPVPAAAAMVEAGLHLVTLSAAEGGLDAAPADAVEMLAAIGAIDGSSALGLAMHTQVLGAARSVADAGRRRSLIALRTRRRRAGGARERGIDGGGERQPGARRPARPRRRAWTATSTSSTARRRGRRGCRR